MNFTRIKKINISEQIVTSLREMILSGKIKPQQKLPPERELANQFGTNRNTLREALKILESDGLIEIRQGGGIEVRDFEKNGKINLLPYVIRHTKNTSMKAKIISDSLYVRSVGLAEISRIAAEKIETAQIDRIRDSLERIKSNIGTENHRLVFELEMDFLKSIVEATNSIVLMWFFNTIREITEDVFEEFEQFWNISDEYCSSLEKIYDAIKDRSPERAYRFTREHFERIDKTLFNLFKEVRDAKV